VLVDDASDEEERYDLRADPYQWTTSLDPSVAVKKAGLRTPPDRPGACAGAACL
jgi:hypothetical protein